MLSQVTLEGIPQNPEQKDDYLKNKGPIPKFNNEFGCIQDVVGYKVNETTLGKFVHALVGYNHYQFSLLLLHKKLCCALLTAMF